MTVKRLACIAGFVLVSGGCAADRLVAPTAAPPQPSNILRIRGAGADQPEPLFVIDGEMYGAGHPHPDISPDQIAGVEVIKGSRAVERYGQAGANGVVIIVTTARAARGEPGTLASPGGTIRLRGSAVAGAEPLVLVDGVRVPAAALRDIAVGRILDIQLLKGPAAVERYGEGAAQGVVLVRMKPAGG